MRMNSPTKSSIPDTPILPEVRTIPDNTLPSVSEDFNVCVASAIAELSRPEFLAYAEQASAFLRKRDLHGSEEYPLPESHGLDSAHISGQIARLLGVPELAQNLRWSIGALQEGGYTLRVEAFPAPVEEALQALKDCAEGDAARYREVISQYLPLNLEIDPVSLGDPRGPVITLEEQAGFSGIAGLRDVGNIIRAVHRCGNPPDLALARTESGDLALLGLNQNRPYEEQVSLMISSDGQPFRPAFLIGVEDGPSPEIVFGLGLKTCRVKAASAQIFIDSQAAQPLFERTIEWGD